MKKNLCVLIDILHPAHVHFFKNIIWQLEKEGHTVLITARDKEITIQLLKEYGFKFKKLSRIKKGLFGLGYEMLIRFIKLLFIGIKYKPDVYVGIAGITTAPVAWFLRKPSITITDTEFARLSNSIAFPFSTCILTPSCYSENIGRKQQRYKGYHE